MIPADHHTPETIIRPTTCDDAISVETCVYEAFQPYIRRIGKLPAPMLADFPLLIDKNYIWVAVQHNQIVGVLVTYETDAGFCIDTLAVSPSLQGKGIGRTLLQFAEQEALRRGFKSIYLYTNAKMTENQVFYPKMGYIEYDRRFDEGYDRIFYRKQLGENH